MASTTSTRMESFEASERRFFLREIAGLFQIVAAVLIAGLSCRLYSNQTGERWVGTVGESIAAILNFMVGIYVAYAIPFILVMHAVGMLAARESGWLHFRSWTRVSGAFVLVVSACSLLTLHFGRAAEPVAERVFQAGGVVGSFIIDPRGLNLVYYMGPAGSFIALYSLALAGLILFTETLLRDAARILMRAFRWFRLERLADTLSGAVAAVFGFPGRCMAAVGRGFDRGLAFLGFFRLRSMLNALRDFIPQFHFSRRGGAGGRIMAPRPIMELRGAGFPPAAPMPVFDEAEFEEDEEDLPPEPVLDRKAMTRSGTVFGKGAVARDRSGGARRSPSWTCFPRTMSCPRSICCPTRRTRIIRCLRPSRIG
jgi:hypothetical protein